MEGVSQGSDPRSPRVPDITGRLRSGPVPALRAIFAGIGRIVMAAERPADLQKAPAVPQAASRWRSLDLTGNVRLLSPDDLAEDLAVDLAYGAPGTAAATPAEPAGMPEAPVAGAHSENGATAGPPMDAYDTLSLPSIRARLRGLDLAQVRVLASYERTHAERPEILGMLERRIAKLEAGG
jgi:hypothetical protein